MKTIKMMFCRKIFLLIFCCDIVVILSVAVELVKDSENSRFKLIWEIFLKMFYNSYLLLMKLVKRKEGRKEGNPVACF